MKTLINKTTYYIFAFLCITVGCYPIIYFLIDRHFGLLRSKTQDLLSDQIWNIAFYGHIILGGLALLVGWTQFSSKLRRERLNLHRNIGRVYVIAALASGVCGVYIALFATGGISNVIGFSLSGVIWLATTFLAYWSIKNGEVEKHENYMIYSYAVCFSAVTLRIWLPLLTYGFKDFDIAYRIVGWLSWVPNLVVAYFMVKRKQLKLIGDLSN